MRTHAVALVVVAVAAAASAACGAGERPREPSFAEAIREYLELAPAAGASDAQLAILEQAQESGELPFEDYRAAVDRSLHCLEDVGFAPDDFGVREEFGVPIRDFGFPVEVEDDPADMVEVLPGISEHRCFAEHSSWVQMAYLQQPSSVAARDAHFARYRDAIVECLADGGVDTDPAAGRQEITLLAIESWQEGAVEVDCLSHTGYLA